MSKAKASTKPPPIAEVARSLAIGISSPAFGVLAGGRGCIADQLARELQRSGASVKTLGARNVRGYDEITFHDSDDERKPRVRISLDDPVFWLRDVSRPLFGILTVRADPTLKWWASALSQCAAVLCPSRWILDGARLGTRRATLLRFGINLDVFTYAKRERKDRLRILVHAHDASDARKNVDGAIAAFVGAFPGRSDVELVVHSNRGHTLEKRDARVHFSTGPLTPAQLADLYRSADALLYPSRAEAFGAVALEAMACGTPAIHTGATGMDDFADLGLTVGHRRLRSFSNDCEWREPHTEQLVERLRQVDLSYDDVMAKAEADAAIVAQRYAWAPSVEALIRLLAR